MQLFTFRLLATLDQLQQRCRTAQIASQLQHFLVRLLVVLAILTRLHLLGTPPERQIRIVRRCAGAIFGAHGQQERMLRLQSLVQPVIVHGDADFVVLLEQRFGLVERDNGLAGALLQSVHHLLKLERIDVEPARLRRDPCLVGSVHIVVGDVLLEAERFFVVRVWFVVCGMLETVQQEQRQQLLLTDNTLSRTQWSPELLRCMWIICRDIL